MPKVIIDGTEYVPKGEIPELTDERLHDCLMVLTEMRYFKEDHKMQGLAYEAMKALSPELAELDENEAYYRIHGDPDDEITIDNLEED